MRPKLTPLKPKGAINKEIVRLLKKKQDGSDALYSIAKKFDTFRATIRRRIENENTWHDYMMMCELENYFKVERGYFYKIAKKR